eukprot:15331269-Ditylum_brightwellii.AAC.1
MKKPANTHWMGQIICRLWEHARIHWKAHNGILHSKNNDYNTKKENLLKRIQAAYNHQPNLLVQDHLPFQQSKVSWLTTVTN